MVAPIVVRLIKDANLERWGYSRKEEVMVMEFCLN